MSYFLSKFVLENIQHALGSGHPVRSNRGQGGQREQLEKTLKIMQGDTAGGKKRSRAERVLDDVPEDLPQNDMAPPLKMKRQRRNVVSLSFLLISVAIFNFTGSF